MNSENFVAELRAAAQDATLTHFVQSLCRFTIEVFENGRLETDVLAHLESDFSDADVSTIHSEMRILTRHELVNAMQVHVAAAIGMHRSRCSPAIYSFTTTFCSNAQTPRRHC